MASSRTAEEEAEKEAVPQTVSREMLTDAQRKDFDHYLETAKNYPHLTAQLLTMLQAKADESPAAAAAYQELQRKSA